MKQRKLAPYQISGLAFLIVVLAAIVLIAVALLLAPLVPVLARVPKIAAFAAFPMALIVAAIVYVWVKSEHGPTIVLGLLGGLLIALVAGVGESSLWTATMLATEDHGISPDAVAVVLLVETILFVVVTPLFGWLAGRAARYRLLLAGVLVSAITTAAYALAKSPLLFGIAHIGAALGRAVLLPALLVCILDAVWSRRFYATVAGFYLAARTLGRFAGSMAPVLLVEAFSADSLMGYALVGLILLVAGGIGSVGIGLSRAWSRSRPRPLAQLESPSGRFPVWILALIGVIVFLTGWTVNVIQNYGILDERWSQDERMVFWGIAVAGLMLAVLVGQFLGGLLADLGDWLTFRLKGRYFGRAVVLALGALVLCTGAAIFFVAKETLVVGIALAIIGGGYGLVGPSLMALLLTNSRHNNWGLALGLYIAFGAVVTTLAGVLGGMLADNAGVRSTFLAALISAGLSVVGSLGIFALQMSPPKDRESVPEAAVLP